MEFIRFGFSERNMCCCRQRSQPYTSFQKEPEDTQHLKKRILYGNIIQLRRLLSSLNVFQVPMTPCKSCKETVPSLYSVAMPVPERIDCTAFKGILFLWKGVGTCQYPCDYRLFCRIGRNWNLLFTAPEKYE